MENNKKNILVVDDDKIYVNLMNNIVSKEGHNVFKCFKGLDALEAVNKYKIDMIFLDVMLPDIDGIQVCKKIRDLSNQYIPVVIVTSLSENEEILKQVISCKADDYLRKPIDAFSVNLKLVTFLRIKEMFDSLSINDNEIIKKPEPDNYPEEIIDSIRCGVLLYNQNGIFVYENLAAIDLFGSVINKNVNKFFQGDSFLSRDIKDFNFLDPDFNKDIIVTTIDGKTIKVTRIFNRKNAKHKNNCLILEESTQNEKIEKANHTTLKNFLSSF